MSTRGGWEGENRESKQSKREEMNKKKERRLWNKRGEMKPGWNRWLYLSSLLRENKLWLSNRLQPSCRKSLHMRGAMTHSSLRSLRFLHAFLFWGVLMNDLKSDLFLSLSCLGGTPLGRGRSLMGWEGPPLGKLSCLWREKTRGAASSVLITHQT